VVCTFRRCARDEETTNAQEVLSNRALLVAAGAFQDQWDERTRPSLGFAGHQTRAAENPTLRDLAKSIPRELVNRI